MVAGVVGAWLPDGRICPSLLRPLHRGRDGSCGYPEVEVSVLLQVNWDQPLGFAKPYPFENDLVLCTPLTTSVTSPTVTTGGLAGAGPQGGPTDARHVGLHDLQVSGDGGGGGGGSGGP